MISDSEAMTGLMDRPDTKILFNLTQDNDYHWYVIPSDKGKDFNEWLSLDSDDERSWDAPSYAKMVGGSPSLVKFTGYSIV